MRTLPSDENGLRALVLEYLVQVLRVPGTGVPGTGVKMLKNLILPIPFS